jgi:hypothetical protein
MARLEGKTAIVGARAARLRASTRMPQLSRHDRRALGLRAARTQVFVQDKVWARYSNDKIDIAHRLSAVIRTLSKALPLQQPLRALSIGSSNEPQFRILESAFRGGLYLLDIEAEALDIVRERVRRQRTDHVFPLRGDYRSRLGDLQRIRRFRARHLGGRRVTLVTLHHSLYYSPQSSWLPLIHGLYRGLLSGARAAGPSAAIHAVLMAKRSLDPRSTTWLYDRFAGQYFGVRNDQDLRAFGRALRGDRRFGGARIVAARSHVHFFVPDFEQFMGVIWMILLHPTVHRFSRAQQCEVIEYVYRELWSRGRPLVQEQDHLVIYRMPERHDA